MEKPSDISFDPEKHVQLSEGGFVTKEAALELESAQWIAAESSAQSGMEITAMDNMRAHAEGIGDGRFLKTWKPLIARLRAEEKKENMEQWVSVDQKDIDFTPERKLEFISEAKKLLEDWKFITASEGYFDERMDLRATPLLASLGDKESVATFAEIQIVRDKNPSTERMDGNSVRMNKHMYVDYVIRTMVGAGKVDCAQQFISLIKDPETRNYYEAILNKEEDESGDDKGVNSSLKYSSLEDVNKISDPWDRIDAFVELAKSGRSDMFPLAMKAVDEMDSRHGENRFRAYLKIAAAGYHGAWSCALEAIDNNPGHRSHEAVGNYTQLLWNALDQIGYFHFAERIPPRIEEEGGRAVALLLIAVKLQALQGDNMKD